MTAYQPKTYQNSVPESVETYRDYKGRTSPYGHFASAKLSNGLCRFVMVTNRQWDGIDALL